LEWQTLSPPPTENFDALPVVEEEAYAYGVKEAHVV
jgi:heme/copper-type cytochrome/quinol oxidase subunit 1